MTTKSERTGYGGCARHASHAHAAGAEAAGSRATVNLSRYTASWYRPGWLAKRMLWYLASAVFVNTFVPYPSRVKRLLLSVFGARIGRGVVIKPSVNIKYPWFLEVGENTWIGEGVWIDNLSPVKIGSNVCVSQGAHLMTGNHDYKRVTFDLLVEPLVVEDGVWVGARATVCPGVRLATHSVVTVGSVITKDTEPYVIYAGNPARPVRARVVS